MRLLLVTAALAALAAAPAGAQSAAGAVRAPDAAPCTYARCALGIAPAWNGLDVVRGASAERVARLGFFWAGDVRPVFAGNDSAVRYAGRAVRTRRVAALLTDLGGATLALGAARLVHRPELRGTAGGLTLGGLAMLGLSVPFQFAADGHLSRAVWWHNARFGARDATADPPR